MAKLAKNSAAQAEIFKLPYLVLIVSMLITLGATFLFYKSAEAKDAIRFENEVANVKHRIEVLISTNIAVVKAGRGFVESTENLNAEKFGKFVRKLEMDKNFSGIQGIGYVKKVPAEDCDELIKKMKTEGFLDFKIYPELENSHKQIVMFIEPRDGNNAGLIGFDMTSDIASRETMDRARDSGEVAATGKVSLARETVDEKSGGFMIYAPVYKSGNPQTIEERQNLLDGYVYSPFRADSFLQDIQENISASDIAVKIYENEKRDDNLLAQTGLNNSLTDEGFSASSEINVAGRKWIIEYQTLPSFGTQSSTGWTPLIFISGLIFSMLLFGMTYLETYARNKAENMSSELQESEREKGFLLEREQLERRRAEDASKAKDEFISIVSHELRTPLNAIAGWTKILNAENLSPAIKKQALRKIDKNLREQTKIVEELLDFSQLVSNKINLRLEQIDFSKLFEEVYSQISAAAREKEILIIKDNFLNGQTISGDSEKLRKVVWNLLSNAIKFTPRGGKVTAVIEEKESSIEMTIQDTGQGIKKDFLPYIFERFKQADSSTTRTHGGLGLGLAISRHIVNLHGGTIEAASGGDDKGATFIVKLPFHKRHFS